jgi:hypothetical protein
MNAGAPELQKALVGMPRQKRRDVEFALAVEAEIAFGDLSPQQAVGADYLWLRPAETIDAVDVDDEKMVATGVERADVAPHQRRGLRAGRSALLEKHLIAQALRFADFLFCHRQPDLEGSKAPENGGQAV